MKIKVLKDDVINCIAAGEVVERPYSVVRELVDNSLDAGADQIAIYLEQGGRTAIKVVDNGCGMERSDALLAFERHATSKIQSRDDIFAIATLGFRGEALASIAAVSRITLTTRAASAVEATSLGVQVIIEGGTVKDLKEIAASVGTTIEVRNLFFNTPARKKFLRTPAVEERRVLEWVRLLALAHPQVRFLVNVDGVERLRLVRRESVLARAADLYPSGMYPLEVERVVAGGTGEELSTDSEGRISAVGLVGHPRLARSDRASFGILVNGRVVLDRLISKALRDGFGMMLKSGSYPVGFLNLAVDPRSVDLNVHPQKMEVRFRDEREIYALVQEGVQDLLKRVVGPERAWITPERVVAPAIGASALFADYGDSKAAVAERREQQSFSWSTPEAIRSQEISARQSGASLPATATSQRSNSLTVAPELISYPVSVDQTSNAAGELWVEEPLPAAGSTARQVVAPAIQVQPPEPVRGERAEPAAAPVAFRYSELRYIGMLMECFLLCEGRDTKGSWQLVMVDMHAAHERLNFNRILEQAKSGQVNRERLLLPLELAFEAEALEILRSYQEVLANFGLHFKETASGVAIEELPLYISARAATNLLQELTKQEWDLTLTPKLSVLMEPVAARLACHASIRSGDKVSTAEVYALFEQLDQSHSTLACPHGRPIAVTITRSELERMFGR